MIEQTHTLGANGHLVATLTLPSTPPAGGPAPMALLTNSGVISRVGPHRMNVHLARRLAAKGIASIRFDMSGIGDSRRSGGVGSQMDQWVLDTRAVMDFAQRRTGCERYFMVGFCSGAEVAHRTALVDERLSAMLLWDLYAYPTLQSRIRAALFRVRRSGVSGLWRKLRRVLGSAPGGSGAAASGAARPQQDLEPPVVPRKEDFAAQLQALVDRRVEVLVMYCGGEPLWHTYPGQFRDAFAGQRFLTQAQVGCVTLGISDHLLTRHVAQQAFLGHVERWLDTRVLPALAPHQAGAAAATATESA